MERKALMTETKVVGSKVANMTQHAVFEFGRAVTTILIGGLFLFYSYVASVGAYQTLQNGAVLESVLLGFMFLVASGAFVLYVSVINGKHPGDA